MQYHMAVRLKACQKEVGLGVQQRTLLKDVQKKDCWKNNWRDYSRKTAGERHAKERLLKKDYWRMTAEKEKKTVQEWWRKMCWKKAAEEGLVKKVCWNQTKRRGILPVQAAGDTVPACRPSALSPGSGQRRLAPAGRRRSSQAAPGLFLVTRVASGTAAGTAMQAHSQQFIIRLITTTHSTWGQGWKWGYNYNTFHLGTGMEVDAKKEEKKEKLKNNNTVLPGQHSPCHSTWWQTGIWAESEVAQHTVPCKQMPYNNQSHT